MFDSIKKRCTECKIPKTLEEFHRNKRGKYGYASKCKKCKNIINALWERANPEKISQKNKRFRQNHPDRIKQIKKIYIEANKEKVLAGQKKWREANLDKFHASLKRWRQANPEWQRNWATNNRDKVNASAKKTRLKYPERNKARDAVRHAVVAKKLPPAKALRCSCCGQPGREYHHHKGYAKEHWLDVIPVCRPCHEILDATS